MPISGVPGQQATPNAIRAMPVTRATSMATPVSSSPNNNCPTSDGTISNAKPVPISAAAAKVSNFLIALLSRARHSVGNGSGLLACPSRFRRRFELEGQLVDLAGELERDIVAILHHRDPGTGVLADVERFVLWERDRD